MQFSRLVEQQSRLAEQQSLIRAQAADARSCMGMQIIQHSEEVEDAEGGDPLSLRGTLEAIHSVDLAHPNVVQTYKSTQRPIAVSSTSHQPIPHIQLGCQAAAFTTACSTAGCKFGKADSLLASATLQCSRQSAQLTKNGHTLRIFMCSVYVVY